LFYEQPFFSDEFSPLLVEKKQKKPARKNETYTPIDLIELETGTF